MTIKHKSNMSFDPVYLAKLESGKEEFPVGIHKVSRGYGYRISRTFKGKDYRFGTFQSLEHALRTNEYLNRLLDAVNEELDKRPATTEDIEELLFKHNEPTRLDGMFFKEFVRGVEELKHNTKTSLSVISKIHENQNKSWIRRLFNL